MGILPPRVLALVVVAAVAGCGDDADPEQRSDRVGPFRKTLETAERAVERSGVDIRRVSGETPRTLPRPVRAATYRTPDGTEFALLEYDSAPTALRARASARERAGRRRVTGPADNLLLVVTRPSGEDRLAVADAVSRHAGGD